MMSMRRRWKSLGLRQQLLLSITLTAALALLALGLWASKEGRRVVERERLALLQSEELGMTPLAEGIEHEAQATTLLGCTAGQGYFFARPLPVAEIEARYFGGIGK